MRKGKGKKGKVPPYRSKAQEEWTRKGKGKANLVEDFAAFLKASGQRRLVIKAIAPHKDKRLAKEIRSKVMPAPPKNPFAALMKPMVIVPDSVAEKPVIADAGTIIKLADQQIFYRTFVSPITRRADEILVHYGKAERPSLGWITNRAPAENMKPSKGPTFLVKTKSETELNAWEQVRLKIGRLRPKDPTIWVARWLATYGEKHPRELREVTRFFGGKPVKNESFDARCTRLFTLILNTELDMASAKKGKTKSSKKSSNKKAAVEETAPKSSKKKGKSKTTAKVSDSGRISAKDDERVIVRLVKENPRRAGSAKAKIWDKLKKGMTVGEFIEKGGSRASVGRYIENGWIKLKKQGGE